jgi:hypothetical protein
MTGIPREQHQARMRRRIRATDKALTAMVNVLNEEIPDERAYIEALRMMVSTCRQRISAAFPYASEELGANGEQKR